MQATVRSFEPADGSGTVVSDAGVVLSFAGDAFAASGLRLLRPGQRVTVAVDADGCVTLVTIVGFSRT